MVLCTKQQDCCLDRGDGQGYPTGWLRMGNACHYYKITEETVPKWSFVVVLIYRVLFFLQLFGCHRVDGESKKF